MNTYLTKTEIIFDSARFVCECIQDPMGKLSKLYKH